MHLLHLTQARTLLPAVRALERKGVQLERYFSEAQLPSQLITQPFAPVSKRGHFWTFLNRVESREGLETIGFLFGESLDLEQLGPWGQHIVRAASLLEALRRAGQSVQHFAQGNRVHMEQRGDRVRLFVAHEEAMHCTAADHSSLKILMAIVELVADPDWKPEFAALRTRPLESVRELPEFQSCHLLFEQPQTCLEIPTEYLSRPLPPRYDITSADAPVLHELPEGRGIGGKLEILIATFLPHYGPLPAEQAAEYLNVSRTTMFRLLAREGDSYRALTERVRYRAARWMLETPSLSIKEISFTLGYQTPNNFTRAFGRIAGISPTRFRDQALARQTPPAKNPATLLQPAGNW
ncbi:MAG: AraC family transcriptional regulator ligand-binding domain-containing protein [Verrucomicrobiae bacterium]|nr:AraC family transcriptional regulator ligand-binding domain-containing protein [Verrucomicrobiae bacterium]